MATQWKRWAAVALVAAAGLTAGACGGGSEDDEGSTAETRAGGREARTGGKEGASVASGPSIEVVGKEFSYSPATLTLMAGLPMKIVLKNTGSIEHDITVADNDFKLTVPGNNTGEKTLTIDKPGTYRMHCSVAGHETAGMRGTIRVDG